MSLLLGLVLSPFLTTPMPALGQPQPVAEALELGWRRRSCLSLRCNDAEWRAGATAGTGAATARHRASPFPSSAPLIRLDARARSRQSTDNYSNKWRIGSRYDMQVLRDGPNRLAVAVDAGYRLAARSDDGIREAGPVFRGAIDFGRSFGERVLWSQRVLVETGQGQAFVKQSMTVDVTLRPEWTLEGDYVIRHRTSGASGSETAEGWLGIRRRF